MDTTDQIYFYDWALTPNMIWVDLNDINWDEIEDTLMLHPQIPELEGNVLCDFTTLDGDYPELEACAMPEEGPEDTSSLRGGFAVE